MSVITLKEAREHLQIDEDYTLTDEVIQGFIDTAEAWCEEYTGLSFTVKDFVKVATSRRTELIKPLVSVESVATMDDLPVNYVKVGNVIHTNCYTPLESQIVIRYSAGYLPDGVPPPIRTAIKLMVADLYQNRETFVVIEKGSMVELPVSVTKLLQPYSRVGGLFL